MFISLTIYEVSLGNLSEGKRERNASAMMKDSDKGAVSRFAIGY